TRIRISFAWVGSSGGHAPCLCKVDRGGRQMPTRVGSLFVTDFFADRRPTDEGDEMKRVGRKLLIASLGVASVGFGACGSSTPLGADVTVDGTVADAGSDSTDAATD